MDGNTAKTVSVREMGRMLGLKKVESYWLAHKGYFKIIQVAGRMRVDLESFEYWYAGQTWYHKTNGDSPGERLKQTSYSARDIAEMLGIPDSTVYVLMKKAGIKPILVNYWQRWLKEDFERWYQGQTRYRTAEDRKRDKAREAASLSFPDVARLLDITRQNVYGIVKHDKRKDLFVIITIADRKRITKKSFNKWYKGQTKYLKPSDRVGHPDYIPKQTYADQLHKDYLDRVRKRKKRGFVSPTVASYVSANRDYLTIDEASLLAKKSSKTILRWIKEQKFPAHLLTPLAKSRIEKTGFENYLKEIAERE